MSKLIHSTTSPPLAERVCRMHALIDRGRCSRDGSPWRSSESALSFFFYFPIDSFCCVFFLSPTMMMNSIPCCSSLYNQTNPCDANSQSQRASCFRPLQQLYKTVYCPDNGNKSSPMVVACICRPSERYKTTNMTYGSFYYDQSLMRSGGTAGRPNCGSRSNE